MTDAVQTDAAGFLARLRSRSSLIGVIGLGYVGLPLCLTLAEAGVRVLGFDVDPTKPEAIAAGRTYLKQFPSERIAAVSQSGRLSTTSNMGRLGEPDALAFCSALGMSNEPGRDFVEAG